MEAPMFPSSSCLRFGGNKYKNEHKNNNDDLEAVVLTEQPARDIETADRQLFHASLDSLLTDFKSHMERIDIMEPSYERAGWRTAIIPT